MAKKPGRPRSRGAGAGAPAGRGGHVQVRSKKRRKASSRRWLERQLNDPFVAAAKRHGYRSRAAFKLTELDDRWHFLKPGATVVDLGAVPGGWTQVAVERVAGKGKGEVVAVDLADMDLVPGAGFVKVDILDPDAAGVIARSLSGLADVVLSDMAAPATGHRQTDHLRTMALCEAAFDLAERILAPGGSFVAKVLKGGTEGELLVRMKQRFATVRHAKPKSSRSESAESYVVALDFRGDRKIAPD